RTTVERLGTADASTRGAVIHERLAGRTAGGLLAEAATAVGVAALIRSARATTVGRTDEVTDFDVRVAHHARRRRIATTVGGADALVVVQIARQVALAEVRIVPVEVRVLRARRRRAIRQEGVVEPVAAGNRCLRVLRGTATTEDCERSALPVEVPAIHTAPGHVRRTCRTAPGIEDVGHRDLDGGTDGRLLQPVARLRDGVIDDVVDAARDGTHVHDGCLHAAGCGDDGLIPPLGGEGV